MHPGRELLAVNNRETHTRVRRTTCLGVGLIGRPISRSENDDNCSGAHRAETQARPLLGEGRPAGGRDPLQSKA